MFAFIEHSTIFCIMFIVLVDYQNSLSFCCLHVAYVSTLPMCVIASRLCKAKIGTSAVSINDSIVQCVVCEYLLIDYVKQGQILLPL